MARPSPPYFYPSSLPPSLPFMRHIVVGTQLALVRAIPLHSLCVGPQRSGALAAGVPLCYQRHMMAPALSLRPVLRHCQLASDSCLSSRMGGCALTPSGRANPACLAASVHLPDRTRGEILRFLSLRCSKRTSHPCLFIRDHTAVMSVMPGTCSWFRRPAY